MQDSFNPEIPNLFKVERTHDRETALRILTASLVKSVTKYLNGNECKMDTDDFRTLSEMILDEYPDMKINEIDLIIRRAAFQDYGPIYNNISIASISGWIKAYMDKRQDYHAAQRERVHQRKKEAALDAPVDKEIQEKFRKLGEKHSISEALDAARIKRIAKAQANGQEPDYNDMEKIEDKRVRQ